VFFDATLTAYGYFGERDAVYERWHDETKYFTPHVRQWAADRERRVVVQFEKIYQVKHKTLRRFYESGGADLITTGTDHVSTGEYLGGFAIHRELHAFVRAGIAPADALKMATINGARALGVSDRLGTIESGKLADLIVIKGDPLADIRATRMVHTVVRGGVVHDSAALLKSVEGTLGPAGDG
jgi:imidazolonepropionase-like amidohydrolase